jgi:hypothetical protein
MSTVAKNFNFPIAELVQRGDKCGAGMERDAEQFAAYGSTPEHLAFLKETTAQLKAFPTDQYYEGLQKLATDEKRQARDSLEIRINDLRNRVKLTYGNKSMQYSLFHFKAVSLFNDSELVQHASHVINVASNYLEPLGGRQVTQTTLDEIEGDGDVLDDAIDNQDKAHTERRLKSQERIVLANKLYKMISKACDIGKMVWKNKNEAYYTDYVIYGSSKGMEEQANDEENGDDPEE